MNPARLSPCLWWAAVWLAIGALGVARAGTISGKVTAKGPPVAEGSGDGEYSSHRYSLAERVDYKHLQDFVVYIDQAVDAAPPQTATVVQHDVSFEPHVLPIVVGTKVFWPNKDSIFHNVYSLSETKEFDLGLYTTERIPDIVFDKVGRVDVYCSIHEKMHCIILVLPCRYFAKTDSRGNYVIPDVPAGTYRIKAWQERMPPSKSEEIAVTADGITRKDFVLGFSGLPQY
jgi:plastocyanin